MKNEWKKEKRVSNVFQVTLALIRRRAASYSSFIFRFLLVFI